MYPKENGTLGFYRRDYQDHCIGLIRLTNLKPGQQVYRDNDNQSNGQGECHKSPPKTIGEKYE